MGGRPANRGRSLIEPEAFGRYVARLDALGFQAHVHAIGDRAVREALDAVAVARRANGPSDTRPHIAHIQLIHPDDIGRFRALDVAANAQADWAALEDQLELADHPLPRARSAPTGCTRSARCCAPGRGWRWARTGASRPPTRCSRWRSRSTGSAIEHRGEKPPFLPDERIDLDDALAAFTLGSAWVNHLDGEVGSIEVGKAADLVVLDRDLFDRAAGEIGEARVVATFIDGVAVHEGPELEG